MRLQPLLLILLVNTAIGQTNIKDSLQQILLYGKDDQQRVDVLNSLAYQYYDFQDTLALQYAERALELAKKLNYLAGQKYAYTMVALGYTSTGQFSKAVTYHQLSDAIDIPNVNDKTVYNLTSWGIIYRDQAKFDSALLLYRKARSMLSKDDHLGLASNLKNVGSILLRQWKIKDALITCDSARYHLAKSATGNQFLEMDIYSYLGEIYRSSNQFEQSKLYYDKMCAMAFSLQDTYHQITCKLNESKLAFDLGDTGDALRVAFEALDQTKRYHYPPQYVGVLIHIGDIYESLSEFDVATEYYYRALRVTEPTGLDQETGAIFSALAWINKEQGNFKYALDFLDRAQMLREKIGDQCGIANCHNVRGLIYLQLGEFDKSLQEQNKGLVIRREIDYQEGVAASQYNIGLVYEKQGKMDKALELMLLSAAIEEKILNQNGLAISYNTLGDFYMRLGDMRNAATYLQKANKIGQVTRSKLLLRNNAANYVKYFQKLGDYRKALEYQKLFQTYNDSVYSNASAIKLIEVQALYETEKRESDLEALRQKQKISEAQIQLQDAEIDRKNMLIFFAAVLFAAVGIAGYFFLRLYRQKEKANFSLKEQKEEIQAQSEELTEANQMLQRLNRDLTEKQEEIQAQTEELTEAYQTISRANQGLEEKVQVRTEELRDAYKELDTFFYRSSHDFRRPLTTFMGLAEVAKITLKDPNALELFEKVNETAHNLDKMLVKLQSISDLGSQHLVFKEVFLKELVVEVLDQFKENIGKQNIQTIVEVEPIADFYSYPLMIKIIVENLVENSIHFCNRTDPFIKVSCRALDHQVAISVADNGQGIEPQFYHQIFDMYFRANQHSKGNGLGLYIAKKAADKLGGGISFTSVQHQGSVFTVLLPLGDK
jgi:signal transduction histidine kinase